MANKAAFFYVLECKDGTFYAGYTVDLARRLAEHNQGIGAKYTRPATRRPLKMIHFESFETKSAAMQAEAAFKKLSRTQKEKYLNQNKRSWQKCLASRNKKERTKIAFQIFVLFGLFP